MQRRTGIIKGKHPILFTAPHGSCDVNTAKLAMGLAEHMDAYAVINYGWQRAAKYDYDKEHANCNNIQHLHEDVVKQEFLDPILRITDSFKDGGFVFNIHGMMNNQDNCHLAIGFGAGTPPMLSADLTLVKCVFYNFLDTTLNPKIGRGKYGGRDINNLNQLFRRQKWYPNRKIQSIQLEFSATARTLPLSQAVTGAYYLHYSLELYSKIKEDINNLPADWDQSLERMVDLIV